MKVIDVNLLNLKIISKIPENGRVIRSESGTLALDHTSKKITWLKRFVYGDSRKRALDDITNVVDFSIEKCNDIINSKFFEEYSNNDVNNPFIKQKIMDTYTRQYELLEIIYSELKGSIQGLINLKTTYYDDVTTVSKIDIVISKIRNYTTELEKNYLYINKTY